MNTFVKNNSLLIGSIKEQPEYPHNPNNLVLVYDTSKEPANNTVSVPLNGTVNCTIYWGDGSSETHTTTGFKTHTYASAGVYIVQISGTMTQLNYGTGASTTNNKAKLVRCLSFGAIGLTSLSNAFYNCNQLIQCPASLPTSSAVTTFSNAFFNCTQFNDARIGSWNTAAVTNMSNMFRGASAFNQPIGGWNTAAVTNMSAMFSVASAFNQPIGGWNTAAVTNMSSMFQNAPAFNQPIGGWNTAAATNMNSMFQNEPAFNQPIGDWNTGAVTNMSNMFQNASVFNQDISGWDIRKVTSMAIMFSSNNWGTTNYDAALIAWSQLSTPQTGVSFGVGSNKYSSSAVSARNVLINTYNWNISDGGLL